MLRESGALPRTPPGATRPWTPDRNPSAQLSTETRQLHSLRTSPAVRGVPEVPADLASRPSSREQERHTATVRRLKT